MLRTTKKTVIRELEDHVLKNFWPDNYGEGTVGLQNLKDQIDHMRLPGQSIYQTGINYAEGGSLLVYYYDQRKFLAELLEETPEESEKYSDDQVFKLYCHLVARTISQLYDARVKELERLS